MSKKDIIKLIQGNKIEKSSLVREMIEVTKLEDETRRYKSGNLILKVVLRSGIFND